MLIIFKHNQQRFISYGIQQFTRQILKIGRFFSPTSLSQTHIHLVTHPPTYCCCSCATPTILTTIKLCISESHNQNGSKVISADTGHLWISAMGVWSVEYSCRYVPNRQGKKFGFIMTKKCRTHSQRDIFSAGLKGMIVQKELYYIFNPRCHRLW